MYYAADTASMYFIFIPPTTGDVKHTTKSIPHIRPVVLIHHTYNGSNVNALEKDVAAVYLKR
jgi:hypothetical protein